MNTDPHNQPIEPGPDETINLVPDDNQEPMLEENNIDALRQKLAEAENEALLAQADLENFRKRNRREMQDQIKFASLKLMADLLEAVDNLNRAIDAAQEANPATNQPDPSQPDSLLQGVSMVARQISTVLENHGCKKIDAVGQPFDPNRHQAIQMQPSDEFQANVVSQELIPGFLLHDRVIRPSQVFVSTGNTNDNE